MQRSVVLAIGKINGVINPPMGKGGSCSSPVCGKLLFQTNFSCVLALKWDEERVMEGVVRMPPPNGLKIDLSSFFAVGASKFKGHYQEPHPPPAWMNCNHQLFLTSYQLSVQHIVEFDEIPASRRGQLGNKNKKFISSSQYKFDDCLPPKDRC